MTSKTTKAQTQAQAIDRTNWHVTITFLAVALMILMTNPAYATNTPMGDVLCDIVEMVYGNLGRGLATLAVVIIGVGATLGKTSWGLALTVAVGIAVIFNAHKVVGYLGNGAQGCPIDE